MVMLDKLAVINNKLSNGITVAQEDSNSIQDWMTSERLYEEHLFFYFFICLFWFLLGLFTIGFQFSGYSPQENLLFNFIWYLIIVVAMSFTPFWYRLIFGSNAYLFRETAKVYEQLDKITDFEQRQQTIKQLASTGKLPPNIYEVLCFSFLFAFILFDWLYASTWVRDMALVWQPDWVNACINWVHSHLNMPPLNEDRKIFDLYFNDGAKDSILKEHFSDEWEFLASPFGDVVMFYHFMRVVLFIPIITALSVVLWKPLRWLGMDKIDPRKIDGVGKFLQSSAWSIVIGFFTIGMGLMMISEPAFFALSFLNSEYWLNNIEYNFAFVFIVMGVYFFSGWLVFWKRFFLKLIGK